MGSRGEQGQCPRCGGRSYVLERERRFGRLVIWMVCERCGRSYARKGEEEEGSHGCTRMNTDKEKPRRPRLLDSRFRGNDGVGRGNDGVGLGNDVGGKMDAMDETYEWGGVETMVVVYEPPRRGGATCPGCGRRCGVDKTMPEANGVRVRYHRCGGCGRRFQSQERTAEDE